MKNIFLLLTGGPSKLWINNLLQGKLELSKEILIGNNTAQYIYITSDEEIKEGDWCVDIYKFKNNHNPIFRWNDKFHVDAKKIILTTDLDLIKEGVQAINDEFLEWFIQNPSCEFVKVILDEVSFIVSDNVYKIIIPKEEPKKYPIGGYAPGNYNCNCVTCKQEFIGDKYAQQCEPCAIKMVESNGGVNNEGYAVEEPKQETLEEAAIDCWAAGAWDNRDDFVDGFIDGAKWQAERMYSKKMKIKLPPKEKAKQIVDKVYLMLLREGNLQCYKEAKLGALIVLNDTIWVYLDQMPVEEQNYWVSVKQEIENSKEE